jgi:hypothetical protein
MPAVSISPADLEPFATIDQAKAEAMIEDALAVAEQVAPCLFEDDLTPKKAAAAKAVIRRALLRWNEAGTGAAQSLTALAFSQTIDTRQQNSRGLFWPSEVTELQDICKSDTENASAWSYDTVGTSTVHADVCSLRFGTQFCSCGADIAGYPLWEGQP